MTAPVEADSRIVFYDPACPTPYSTATLERGGVGGSEACVVRVAHALGARVMQHCRHSIEGNFWPPFAMPNAEHVVVLRDARALREARRLFPNARLHLWLHDLVAPGSSRARWLSESKPHLGGVTVICVSDFLHTRATATFRALGIHDALDIRTIYNPIDDDLAVDGTPIDDRKLLFMSSPNKGLDYSLTAFRAIARIIPGLRLFVANPGYKDLPRREFPDVEWLGVLPPARAIAHARSALAVFMPNLLLPETFGLVFAESNAVGTPVLAHDVGAAREVLHASNPVIPARRRQRAGARLARWMGTRAPQLLSGPAMRMGLFDDYVEILRGWRAGHRPVVVGNPRFRLSAVVAEWRQLLR